MTRDEQKEFILDLCRSVHRSIESSIEKGRIPAEWDGHELRQYIADKFAEQTTKLDRRRMREYRNHVAVTSGL